MSQSYNAALLNNIIHEFQKGNKKDSFDKLKKFVDNNPNDEIARYNFAYMCEQLNNIDLAIDNYIIINKKYKKNWRSRFNLYLIYFKQAKYDAALKLANNVLKIKNDYQPALRDKAVILYYLNKPNQGLPFVLKSLKQNSSDYIALNALGLIYMEMKKFNDAEKILKKAIEIKTDYAPSYNNLGRCVSLQNDRDQGLFYYKKALEMNSNFIEAINNVANYYSETGSYEKGIEYYNRALKLDPSRPEIIYNIGVAYVYLQQFSKAEEYYKKAFKLNPHDSILQENYAILLLATQRYEEAWKLFDGRLKLEKFKIKNSHFHNIRDKLWQGDKINKNNKILVIKEQGVGDEILYGSMYSDLIKKYKNLQIESDSRLISLFNRSFKVKDKFVPYSKYSKNKKNLKHFDTIIYAASLGRMFRNKISDFPQKKFLIADEKKSKKLKKILDLISSKFKIGIAWKSRNDTVTIGPAKSINLNLLLPVLKLEKFTFINLQFGDTEKEIDEFYKTSRIKIHSLDSVDLYDDFESTSALLKNLDLFITVSNSTTHLSGALGVETWTIKPLNHAIFHYWNQPTNTTPWYPSIRLFSHKNNWKGTVAEIKEELIKKFM